MQWKLIKYLYDQATVTGRTDINYLKESAEILRTHMGMSCSRRFSVRHLQHSRAIRLVYNDTGPEFRNIRLNSNPIQKCANTIFFYTKSFAELYVKYLIQAQGALTQVRHLLVSHFLANGNPFANFIPSRQTFRIQLAEAIIMSPWINGAIAGLITEATSHNEWLTLSIDCTLRVLRNIRG